MKINKEYIMPLTLVVCALIIGGSYLMVQVNKQNSIERQQQTEIELKKEKEEQGKAEERVNKMLYDWCVEDAEKKYWDYMRLNGTEREDGSIWANTWIWDEAEKRKQTAINNCVIRYLK